MIFLHTVKISINYSRQPPPSILQPFGLLASTLFYSLQNESRNRHFFATACNNLQKLRIFQGGITCRLVIEPDEHQALRFRGKRGAPRD